ncbi:unnamed protein product, partial [Polarella glacialis]
MPHPGFRRPASRQQPDIGSGYVLEASGRLSDLSCLLTAEFDRVLQSLEVLVVENAALKVQLLASGDGVNSQEADVFGTIATTTPTTATSSFELEVGIDNKSAPSGESSNLVSLAGCLEARAVHQRSPSLDLGLKVEDHGSPSSDGKGAGGKSMERLVKTVSFESVSKAVSTSLSRSNTHSHRSMVPVVCSDWLDDPEEEQVFPTEVRTDRTGSVPRLQTSNLLTGQALKAEGCVAETLVMRPSCLQRLSWDLLSVMILTYDVLLIPFEAFEPEETTFLAVMDWITVIFWTVDIPVQFLTGFHSEGVLEMRPSKIARKYVKSWFIMDASVVLLDWILITISPSMKSVVRLGKTNRAVRLTRFLRTMRLLRTVKIGALFAQIFDWIKSELVRTLAYLVFMVVMLVIICHYLACVWWAIGIVEWDQSHDSHVKIWRLEDRSLEYRYLTSLHWALTQFTPASMEVFPQNTIERLYALVVALFGVCTFGCFISQVTSGMMNIQKLKTEPLKQEAILRRYFKENSISAELGQRIWRFLKDNYFSSKNGVHRKDIAVLRLLPESLRSAMSEELFLPGLRQIPFFEKYNFEDDTTVCAIVHRAMIEVSLLTGDELFSSGQPAHKLYLLTSGVMDYWHCRDKTLHRSLHSDQWACEPALWLEWIHCGDMRAHTCCEVVGLDARTFRDLVFSTSRCRSFL